MGTDTLGGVRQSCFFSRREKPAGVRTHMLVGLGACAFYLVIIEFSLGPLKDTEGISPDPAHVFEGVITGIGFLGAGTITPTAILRILVRRIAITGLQLTGFRDVATKSDIGLLRTTLFNCDVNYFSSNFSNIWFAIADLDGIW